MTVENVSAKVKPPEMLCLLHHWVDWPTELAETVSILSYLLCRK